jgi:hypothetical protein
MTALYLARVTVLPRCPPRKLMIYSVERRVAGAMQLVIIQHNDLMCLHDARACEPRHGPRLVTRRCLAEGRKAYMHTWRTAHADIQCFNFSNVSSYPASALFTTSRRCRLAALKQGLRPALPAAVLLMRNVHKRLA